VNEGHIDHCVRKSIKLGLPPITALQIASINTARHYRLRNFGAIAPRFWADFMVFDRFEKFSGAADLQKRRAGRRERKISRQGARENFRCRAAR
jgi:adenine deaminase